MVLTAIPGDSPAVGGDVGMIDLASGTVAVFATGFGSLKGMLYLPGHHGHGGEGQGANHGHGGEGQGANHGHSRHGAHGVQGRRSAR